MRSHMITELGFLAAWLHFRVRVRVTVATGDGWKKALPGGQLGKQEGFLVERRTAKGLGL